MELYILDNQLRRVEVFDQFESLIWTDRLNDLGDLQMTIVSSYMTKSRFVPGAWVATNVSNRMMLILAAVDKVDTEGRKLLNVTGVSFEVWMQERSTLQAFVNSTGAANLLTITGTPGFIAREVFRLICKDNATPSADNFPFIADGNLYPPDTIPEPSQTITVQIEADTVFNVVRDICQIYNLGFRLTRNLDNSQMFFNVYSGNDRTTKQTTLPAVVFSASLDNLQNTSTLQSIAEEKNVAYVFSKNATQVVYANPEDATKTGFQRKILVVDAKDIDEEPGTVLNTLLRQRGQAELSKHRAVSGFDGEIPQYGSYIYDVDYQMGDLVEMRGSDGITNEMRVTEQIFAQDAQGFRSYPTLTINEIITPGTWSSWESSIDWINATGDWINQ